MIKKFVISTLLLLTSLSSEAYIYCSNAAFDAETRFSGDLNERTEAELIYYGPKDNTAENKGWYLMKSATYMIMEFPGEPRHFCNKTGTESWSCKRGKSPRGLRYSMVCREEP